MPERASKSAPGPAGEVGRSRWPDRLVTPRLVLRLPRLTDVDAVFEEYASDPDVTRYLVWRPHASRAETQAFIEGTLAGWESGRDLTWALTLAGADRVIGMIAARPDRFKADIGYVLARRFWGQGLIAEAGGAVIDRLFADPEIHRVWALCDVDNRASARVLEKLGMAREGILRRWLIHPNISTEPRDCLVYARMRDLDPEAPGDRRPDGGAAGRNEADSPD